MKQVYLYGCAFFQFICLYFVNRRKRHQDKTRSWLLKRLKHLSATAD